MLSPGAYCELEEDAGSRPSPRALVQDPEPVLDQREPRGPRPSGTSPFPGGPNRSTFAHSPSQTSPLASTRTRAFDTAGTRVKSKVSSVLPGGSFASAQCRSRRRRSRSATSWLASAASRRAGGPPVAVGAVGEASPQRPHGGQARLLEQQVELGRVHDEAVAEESALGQLSGVKQHVDLGGEPSFAATAHGPGASRPTGGRALRPPRASSSTSKGAAVGVRGGTGRRGRPSSGSAIRLEPQRRAALCRWSTTRPPAFRARVAPGQPP